MKSIVRDGGLMAGAALLLAGCGGFDGTRDGGPATGPAPLTQGVADTPVKLGAPYTIGGVTHTPADVVDYDDVGYASRHGDDVAGRLTANGEAFNPAGISAAHKTLPLPSYVEVTALDTGRTILVRVNDRGPMANDRLIELSRGAADQLGLSGGIAAVRVRRTNPPMAERAQLRAGRAIPERIATPDTLLAILRSKVRALPVPANTAATAQPAKPAVAAPAKPAKQAPAAKPAKPATPPAPPPSGDDRFIIEGPGARPAPAARPAAPAAGGHVVQVGAFSSAARANAAAKAVGGKVSQAGNVWRVRIGPFASEADAQAALGKAKGKGFRDAVVMRDR
jgi:rare lipoprotein A